MFCFIFLQDNKLVEAWFKFGNGQFKAEVDGLVAELQVPGEVFSNAWPGILHRRLEIITFLCSSIFLLSLGV